jgi:hypothetical protein
MYVCVYKDKNAISKKCFKIKLGFNQKPTFTNIRLQVLDRKQNELDDILIESFRGIILCYCIISSLQGTSSKFSRKVKYTGC